MVESSPAGRKVVVAAAAVGDIDGVEPGAAPVGPGGPGSRTGLKGTRLAWVPGRAAAVAKTGVVAGLAGQEPRREPERAEYQRVGPGEIT